MNENSLQGKICLVTGANSGLGKATTQLLLEKDAHVVMVVRNEQKGRKALEELINKTGKTSAEVMVCDFSSQKSIRNFVETFQKNHTKLDILINNHGAVFSKKALTENGIEKTFAINYLSYFLLTHLLEDLLTSSNQSKIINVTSGAYAATKKWVLDDYNYEKRTFFSFKAYSESKLYGIMFTYCLAKKLLNTGVQVNCYSPGFTRTNFGSGSFIMKLSMKLFSPFGKNPLKAAETAIYLASLSDKENITGKYFENKKVKETTTISNDVQLQQELWELSMHLTGLATK